MYLKDSVYDLLDRCRRVQTVHEILDQLRRLPDELPVLEIKGRELRRRTGIKFHGLSNIPTFSAHDTTAQVAETAVEALLVSVNDVFVAVVGVVFDAAVVGEIEAHGVDAETVNCEEGIHHVTR